MLILQSDFHAWRLGSAVADQHLVANWPSLQALADQCLANQPSLRALLLLISTLLLTVFRLLLISTLSCLANRSFQPSLQALISTLIGCLHAWSEVFALAAAGFPRLVDELPV